MSVMKRVYQDIGRRQSSQLLGAKQDVNVSSELDDLNRRVDTLAISCQALWELLQEYTVLNENQLLEKIQEIDLRDGEDDNRMTQQIRECTMCGRTISLRHKRCLYCGANFEAKEVFARD